jgi:hypothetical protein
MRIAVAVPEAHVKAPVLDAALEATTRLNESLIKEGDVPLFDEVRHSIRWKPEPPGDEHFDHAGVVLGRKWGDCDDMAPYAAASMRASGEDPGARAIVKKSGPKRWHAVVQRSDGTIRDPSKETGMGSHSNGVMGAALPIMMRAQSAVVGGTYIARPQLALRPIVSRDGNVEAWQSRADLPWHWAPGTSPVDIAMAALHASPTSSQAIVGACNGLLRLGEANDVDDDTLMRAAAIRDACEGADWDDLADEYGMEHATAAGQLVGSFFGGITHALTNNPITRAVAPITRPIARAAKPFMPYVNAFTPLRYLDPLRTALETGDPMAAMKDYWIPGSRSGRELFQKTPFGAAFSPLKQAFGNIPGAGQWFAAADPRNGAQQAPQSMPQAAFNDASPQLQELLMSGNFLPPPDMRQQMPPSYSFPTPFG